MRKACDSKEQSSAQKSREDDFPSDVWVAGALRLGYGPRKAVLKKVISLDERSILIRRWDRSQLIRGSS